MTVGLYVGTTENDESLETLFDDDFRFNQEQFRKDTLSLGFKNEAQRVISECKKEDGSYNLEQLIQIAFNHDYYKNKKTHIATIGKIQVISVACIC